jgi:hypothetical protein
MRIADRRLAVAALRFAIVLTLCLLPWPGLASTFTSAFVTVGNVITEDMRLGRIAFRFEKPRTTEAQGWDVALAVRDVPTGATTRPGFQLRLLAYVPLAVFLAIIVAAPVGERRAWPLSLALGGLLSFGFVVLSVSLLILTLFTDRRIGAVHLSPFAQSLLVASTTAMVEASYVAPALIWLATRWWVTGWIASSGRLPPSASSKA